MSSQPLPFGQIRGRPLDCKVGDWVTSEGAPEWQGRDAAQTFQAPDAKPSDEPWLFIGVMHSSAAGEETVWKRFR